MEKLKIASATIFFFIATITCANEGTNSNGKELLSKLITLENETIKTYEGFEVNAIIVKNQPLISTIFEQIDETDPKNPVINNKSILFVMPDVSSADREEVILKISAMKTFKPVVVIQEEIENDRIDPSNALKTVRFKFLDNQGRIRLIEWRDEETGFLLKTGNYDEDGNLLSFRFYLNLKINSHFSSETVENFKGKTTSFSSLIQKYGSFNVNDTDQLVKFCKFALNE